MRKKLFTLLLAVMAGTNALFADSGPIDGIYYIFYGKYLGYEAKVIAPFNGAKYTGVINIPASVKYLGDWYTVTEIGESAFANCTDLTSVIIPSSVKEIDVSAFENCIGLTSITLPGGLTRIEKYAFSGCTGLNSTSVTIPNSVTEIGTGAFSGIKNLIYTGTATGSPWGARCVNGYEENGLVYRDASKTELMACFTSVNGNINLPNTVNKISDGAFSGCTGFTSITIPNSVTQIGNYAFMGCTGLTSIAIPNSVTQIGDYAFSGCTGLTSITIPNSITKIGYHWFSGCTGLVLITIPNSVTEISYSFDGCTGLTSITIPNSVKTISNDAFLNCSSLISITLPESITSIGGTAFSGCVNLPVFDNIRYADTYLVEAVDKSLSTYIIKDGTKWIGAGAFKDCINLISITIPKSVISIAYSFEGCSNLSVITLNANAIVEKGYSSSSYDSKLSKIFGTQVKEYIIGNSVSRIGDYAFYNCTDLNAITLCNSITTIGDNAFGFCANLPAIIIPNSATSIGRNAFESCSSLTSITIPNSVTQIGSRAFINCERLSAINVESENRNYCDIDGVLFNNAKTTLIQYPMMKNSESYSIPESTELISNAAFYNCSRLTSITINNSAYIEDDAFYGCNNLESVHIASISTWCKMYFYDVDANPLYYAQRLYLNGVEVSEIDIPDGITWLGNYAFYNCANLKSVTIPNSVTEIGNKAFYNTNIKCIKLEAIAPPSVFNNSFPENTKVYVPLGTLAAYKSTNWNNYDLRVFDLVTKEGEKAPTSFSVSFGDHTTKQYIASCGLEGGEAFAGNTIEYIGLEPENEYQNIPLFITTTGGDYMTMSCSFTTTALELTTKGSKPVSSTTAILLAESNMSDAEVNCGFEWKRNDAPADMEGNKVYCPVASGQMAGRLKGLKDDVYYKYRAFYQSAAGNMYYGDWQYIFTGDVAVEFDPILYTYGATVVRENEATISGYALAGSEDFTEQGFEYWAESRANGGANAPRRMTAALNEHFFVQASGIALHATLTNLDAGTVYKYRVYGKVGDQYYYGAEQAFTTTGTYTPPTYTITFVNWDGSELQSSQVTEDNMPQYTGEMPERPADEQYTYTFSNWTPEIAPANEDATYTAIYTTSLREYLVTFLDEDGTEISSQYYKYGETPVAPADPVKESTDEYVYIFIGWSPAIVSVTADATYTATYEANSREGVNNIYLDPQTQKIIVNCQVLIQRGDKLYTLQGQEVK